MSSPRAVTAIELVKSLHIDDSSMAALANAMKRHGKNHGMWLAYKREVYKEKLALETAYDSREAELVMKFSRTAKSAAEVTNYGRYEVKLDIELKDINRRLNTCKELMSFINDVDRLFSKQAELLTALLRIDHDVIIADKKTAFDLNVELRASIKRFNEIVQKFGRPWGSSSKDIDSALGGDR